MADVPNDGTPWLSVIGKSLAYLCLEKAREHDAKKFEDVLAKVDFLMGFGLPEKDAAEAAGTSHKSVRDLRAYYERKKAKPKNGKGKSKHRGR
jgi:hypothetical protein